MPRIWNEVALSKLQITNPIATEPKLQISTSKTKYLGPFHFAGIVNVSQLTVLSDHIVS